MYTKWLFSASSIDTFHWFYHSPVLKVMEGSLASHMSTWKAFITSVTHTSDVVFHQDGNGYIDEQELDALLKDLCDRNKMVMSPLTDPFRWPPLPKRETIGSWDTSLRSSAASAEQIAPYHCLSMCLLSGQDLASTGLDGYKKSIMALSDGGKLYRTELEIVLCRDSSLWPPSLKPSESPWRLLVLPTSSCNLVHVWPPPHLATPLSVKCKSAPESTKCTTGHAVLTLNPSEGCFSSCPPTSS